jgi:hypothetical protein
MAGIFGDSIDSRSDFFRVLAHAQRTATSALRRMPADPTLNSVKRQLDAIEQWTANGRTPTEGERNSVGLGLRMLREFEGFDDEDVAALTDAATSIQNYVRHWPDDAAARDPNNVKLF